MKLIAFHSDTAQRNFEDDLTDKNRDFTRVEPFVLEVTDDLFDEAIAAGGTEVGPDGQY